MNNSTSTQPLALVTGAARGIGQVIAQTLAEDGFIVAAADVAPIEWCAGNERIVPIQLDVSNVDAVNEVVSSLWSRFGRFDVLVNNAGITRDNLINKMTDQEWDLVIDINLKAVFTLTRAIAPLMMEQGNGSIINLSSIVGTDGNIGQSNYAATKGGLIAMSKGWAKEFARKGAQVRVNCVAPGFIETPMTVDLPEKVLDFMKSKTPLGRMGLPEDIADGVAFLASDKSRFITGQVLKIDGGLVL